MKIVVLIDDSPQMVEKMIGCLENTKSIFIDTENWFHRDNEYERLSNGIDLFSQSDNEVMLVRYSGDESIAQNLGDEHSQMIISISCDKNSRCYVEHPVKMFLDLLTVFNKGDQLQKTRTETI